MFIGKKDIEDFDKCAVGDILFQDPKSKKFKYQLYNRDNRIVMKLKSRPVMPSAIVSVIEKNGLQIQSISVYDDSLSGATSTIPYTTTPYKWTTTTGTTTTGIISAYPDTTSSNWWSSETGDLITYK